MNLILDASTALNLHNGGVLSSTLALPGITFFVSPEVRKESKTIRAVLDDLEHLGLLYYIDDTEISSGELQACMSGWSLGAGECECILAAKTNGASVACDDLRARSRIEQEIGAARLTGSIGVLRRLVAEKILTSSSAYDAYKKMRASGGFLPDLDADYFKVH